VIVCTDRPIAKRIEFWRGFVLFPIAALLDESMRTLEPVTVRTFRSLNGRADPDQELAGLEMMLNAVIAFARKYPAEAVLLFNGEEIIMRCHDGEIVFDTSEYFEEEPSLAAIVSRHRQEALEQPLMG